MPTGQDYLFISENCYLRKNDKVHGKFYSQFFLDRIDIFIAKGKDPDLKIFDLVWNIQDLD